MKESRSFTRTIIRIAIVAVGISLSVMLLASALIAGFKEEITTKVYGFWGHVHITSSEAEHSMNASPISLNQPFYKNLDSIDRVEYFTNNNGQSADRQTRLTNGGIKSLHPYINLPAMLTSRTQYEGMILRGVGQEYKWDQFDEWIVRGRTLKINSDSIAPEILISNITAKRLELDTADLILISFFKDQRQVRKRARVVGVYNTGLAEYDRKYAMVDYRILQGILGWAADEVGGIEVVLDDPMDMEVISDYIYIEVLPANLFAETIRSIYPTIFEWLALFNMNERFLFIVLVVVAFINMVTVLIILIMERTPMIGLLKALGSKNTQVQSIFLRLASRIIIKGLLVGNGVALILGFLQYHFRFISLDEANYYLSYAPIAFDPIKWIALNLGALVLILVFLIIPSFLILRIDPVKSLRFK